MSLSMYGNEGGDMHSASLDSQMQDMLNQGDGSTIMDDLSTDMLPFDLDLNAMSEADLHGYTHMSTPQAHSQQTGSSMIPLSEDYDGSLSQMGKGNDMVGIGAGPLPTSFGVQLPQSAGSTLTEFTKRRNWSQRVIEELNDFLHILTPDGRLIYVSPSAKTLTGHEPSRMIGKFISDFIHPDDSSMFVREFNESIASGNPLRFFYRFRKPDGTYNIFESHGHPHLASEAAAFGPNSGASFCRGFFMMARPYPTKNAALLDSFLEHKIENERLKKRIADLKREEAEDLEGQRALWLKNHDSGNLSSMTPSESPMPNGQGRAGSGEHPSMQASATPNPDNYNGMPPPAKPTASSTALTRQNLDEALAASRPDSINDKMARYEGATHIETIEMLTGLRYRDGERSKGISTGAASPTLIRGDAGIPIHVDKDGRPTQGSRGYNSPFSESNDKKKKMKVADEYVCTDCGTLDSPEWRKGPNGPKTLCNACGLRWAKKEKKEKSKSGNTPHESAGNGHNTASLQSMQSMDSLNDMSMTNDTSNTNDRALAPASSVTPSLQSMLGTTPMQDQS